jgi:hypothetical protein
MRDDQQTLTAALLHDARLTSAIGGITRFGEQTLAFLRNHRID